MPRKKKIAGPEVPPPVQSGPIRLDIGCGKNKREGFLGVDRIAFPEVDKVMDAGEQVWPWKDGTVDEINASHFLEHLKPKQRIHFINEAYRVLKYGGTAKFITPHWCSHRAYGDLTHEWPPVSEMWFYYLNVEWRKANAPHNEEYTCDFDAPPTQGYNLHPMSTGRSPDWVNFAIQTYKEVCQDMITTLTKSERKPPEKK